MRNVFWENKAFHISCKKIHFVFLLADCILRFIIEHPEQ